MSKKPLSKRVKWIKFPNPHDSVCLLGGMSVVITPWQERGHWEMRALGNSYIIKAKTLSAAKAKALRIVQKAILEAAAEWSDQ